VSSRRGLLLLGLVLTACQWDLTQSVCRTTVEDRVRECLADSVTWPASIPVDPDSFRFAVLTDLHFGDPETVPLEWFRTEALQRGVDFFLVLGDITDNGRAAEFAQAQERLARLDIPYYATIGNHDLYQKQGWESFRATFGPSCYSVVIGQRLQLLFLDTADGTIGPTQFGWLAEQLQAGASYIKVIGTHFPVYDGVAPGIGRLASTAERYKLAQLLDRYSVRAYVAGHTHAWRHTRLGTVDHFIAGSMAPGRLDYGTRGFLMFTCANDSLTWVWIEEPGQ